MTQQSLRRRVMVGALIYGGGTLLLATLAAAAIVYTHPRTRFFFHTSLLILFAVISLVVGVVLFQRGLAPLAVLRDRLSRVRDGAERRMEGEYPSEVQPLVDDLNGLLDDRERRVARAVARAGDLAHGLKTPLAVLAQAAEQARAAGHAQLAALIDEQVAKIIVDDDGPGIAPSMRDAVLQRGVRADEAAPGSGWGLAIVRDLAEAYGGSIALSESPLGGCRATVSLP